MQAVMRAILEAPAENPAWGKSVCDQTGYGTQTVYPALNKLLKARWITTYWEEPAPENKPRRRFYAPAYNRHWYEQRFAETEKTKKKWWQRS